MKTTKNLVVGLMTLLTLTFVPDNVLAHVAPWRLLGKRAVTYRLDKDVIHVGPGSGTYRKLKIQVTGGSLNMHNMVVHYMNGTKQTVALKHNFHRGSSTRVIDLHAGKRLIKSVTFWYDTKNHSKRKATVRVFGRR